MGASHGWKGLRLLSLAWVQVREIRDGEVGMSHLAFRMTQFAFLAKYQLFWNSIRIALAQHNIPPSLVFQQKRSSGRDKEASSSILFSVRKEGEGRRTPVGPGLDVTNFICNSRSRTDHLRPLPSRPRSMIWIDSSIT